MQPETEMPTEFWLTELSFAAHMVKGQIERGAAPSQGGHPEVRTHVLRELADMLDEQRRQS